MTEQTLRRSNWPAAPDAGRRTHDLPATTAGEDPLAELERLVMRSGPFGEPRQPVAHPPAGVTQAPAAVAPPPSNVEPFPARREPTFAPVPRAQPAPLPAATLSDNPFGIDEAAFETALRSPLAPVVTRADPPAPPRPAPAPLPEVAPVRPVEARREPTLAPIRPAPQPAAPAPQPVAPQPAAPTFAAQPAAPAPDPQSFDLDPQFLQALDRELFGQDRPAPPPAPRFDRYADALDGPYDDTTAQQEQPAASAAKDTYEADAYADDMYADDPRFSRDAPLPPVDEPEPELVERPRRRAGLITVVSVVGLVIAGGAGAVAYTVLTGGARQPAGDPPVVRADNRPTRVVPSQPVASTNEPGKIIFDRLGGQQPNPAGERLVAREEQPVAAINQPRVDPRPIPTTTPGGIAEPRRVTTTTIRVRADGTLESEPTRGSAPAAAPRAIAPPPAPVAVPQAQPAPPAPSTVLSLQSAEPPRRAAPEETAAAVAPPLPLPRPANAPARAAEPVETAAPVAPVRQAAIQPPQAQAQTQTQAPAANGRGPFVQVASQRSEDAARSTYADLQRRFPQMLAERQPNIQSISIPDRGTFWRVRVGGFGNRDEAAQFCTRFRSAGGECVIAAN